MMQRPTNEPKPCVGGQISARLLNDELAHGVHRMGDVV